MTFQATILTLFPDMFPGVLGHALAGKALEKEIWTCQAKDVRDFAQDKYKTVDDVCFGGGPGMVIKADVLGSAIDWAQAENTGSLVYLTPRGTTLTQPLVEKFVQNEKITLICGRYEGIDERILQHYPVEEVSIGDYILSGGELAAMVLLDACVRLLPGVMGDKASGEDESFSSGLLEYSHYTRPRIWNDLSVPDILLSGHHEKIQQWRQMEAEELTRTRRPDLWDAYRKKTEK